MSDNMGGKAVLRMLGRGGRDLAESLLPGKLDLGLAGRVDQATHGRTRLELHIENRPPMPALAGELSGGLEAPVPDLVVFSLDPDVFDRVESDVFLEAAGAVVDAYQSAGSHVFFLNGSTIDPSRLVSNYHAIDEPFTRTAQRLDLMLLHLSISHGISIVDVDRLLAEMGAAHHVIGPLEYSAAACEAICEEILRIMTDYGFFEARPLLAQVGSRKGSQET